LERNLGDAAGRPFDAKLQVVGDCDVRLRRRGLQLARECFGEWPGRQRLGLRGAQQESGDDDGE
jgi:hypothetical protein